MDGCEKKDCVIFDGKKIRLGLFRPRTYYFKRAAALMVTTLALLLVGALAGIALLRGDVIRSIEGLGNGAAQSGGGDDSLHGGNDILQNGGNEFFEESLENESQDESEVDGEAQEGGENKEESAAPTPGDTVATVDMSFAEMGDSYIIN